MWHPRGPDKTEVWAWVFVDKTAPPEVKEAIRLAGVRAYSARRARSSRTTWTTGRAAPRPRAARSPARYALSYEMGLGHERFDQELGAWASDYRYSESNHRGFYRRWAQLMAAESWAAVATGDAIASTAVMPPRKRGSRRSATPWVLGSRFRE